MPPVSADGKKLYFTSNRTMADMEDSIFTFRKRMLQETGGQQLIWEPQ